MAKPHTLQLASLRLLDDGALDDQKNPNIPIRIRYLGDHSQW
jgi:hypothetical protein